MQKALFWLVPRVFVGTEIILGTMATSAAQLARLARPAKKLEKPRPLKIPSQNRHSTIDARIGTVEEIMTLTDTVVSHLANGNYDRTLQTNIKNLHGVLKTYGSKLEAIYKDQLDRAFVTFRNGCRDELLDYVSRLLLLELIEMRATQWMPQDSPSYYKHKLSHMDIDIVTTPTLDNAFTPTSAFAPVVLGIVPQPQPLLLGPGELVKSSGKYPAPTKVLGKNYCKDEVVIRNSDSGKVMGIKGRRVHMIEELSETVISFQRVNPGAKERLVQITGPTEEKINSAKQLMEETIRRNASPVRAETDGERMGSSSSLNSSTSDDSVLQGGKRTTLLHSFSTNDATLGEYKYTVTVGDESIKITGTNLDLVRIAKLVLDEYFSPGGEEPFNDDIFEHIEPPPLILPQQHLDADDAIKGRRDLVMTESSPKDFGEGENVSESRSKEKANDPSSPATVIRRYTVGELIKFLDSPYSKQVPVDWARIARDCPAILRKTPIEWLDSATVLARLAQVNETVDTVVVRSSPPGQPIEQE